MLLYGTSSAQDELNDVEKQDRKKVIRQRCCWLLILTLVFFVVAALCIYFYGRGQHKHSNIESRDEATEAIAHLDEDVVDEGIHLEGAIMNELNHPKAYRAMQIVRDILRKNKGGPVLDREFRRSYNIERACCLPNACDICTDIKWYCCDHQPEDDIYLPSPMEAADDRLDDIEGDTRKREEIRRKRQRDY